MIHFLIGKTIHKGSCGFFGLCKFLKNLSVLRFGTNLLGHPLVMSGEGSYIVARWMSHDMILGYACVVYGDINVSNNPVSPIGSGPGPDKVYFV